MDSLLKLLLNLLNVATTCRGPQLLVLPPEDILAVVLAGSALAQQQDQLASIIRAAADGQMSMTASLRHLLDIMQRFESDGAHFALSNEPWCAAATTLDRLLMLNALLEDRCALRSSLAFDDSAMFDFIQLLAIQPTADNPETVLVAQLSSRSGEIEIRRDAGLLRRITITYRRDTIYPVLTVKIPSTTPDAPRRGTRLNWEQRDTPADDLNLYNFDHRPLGQIITRRVRPLIEIQGQKLTLRHSAQSDVEFLVTDVIDTKDTLLGRCIKFVRPHADMQSSSL
jgi:hypothetical protein